MIRFNDIAVHEKEGTVEIGAGLTWTRVYSYLVPKGLNVVGGRLDGVGVGGFTLGGGQRYSAFFAHIVPHYNSPVCLMVRNRIFLEDQPVWPYRGHPYGD